MNIIMVNHYAILPTAPGGTRHFSFARELVRRGHNVTIVASGFNHKNRQETRRWNGERYQSETVDGVRFVWLKTPPYSGNTFARIRNMAAFAYRLLRLPVKALGPTPDIVYGSSPHLFAALAGQRLARRLRLSFVLEIRDLWPESLTLLGDISPKHPFIVLLAYIERFLYRRADHIVTLLPGAGEHMVAKGSNAGKITWIPNGIDLSMLGDIPASSPTDRLVGVYAGTHGLANGLDLLLNAVGVLQTNGWGDRIAFRFVGDGPLKESLKKKATAMGLSNVSFEDPVPKEEVYRVLAEADFFPIVLRDSPLYQWGISLNKLFDYMALGRPIVFSGSAPSNPVELSGAGIATKPGDAAALADGIRKVAEMSTDDRLEFGRRGRAYVEQHHATTVLVNRLEAVLADVARGTDNGVA